MWQKLCGLFLQHDKQHLLKVHTPTSNRAVPIEKQIRQFKLNSGNLTYLRSQFPLELAYASTSHKCQGQTLHEVIIDFSDEKIFPGSFYVALIRVKRGENVYLRKYNTALIMVNEEVEQKMMEMRTLKTYTPDKIYLYNKIFKNENEDVKIGYLNINGLLQLNHGYYLNRDKNWLNFDILVLSETKLKEQTNKYISAVLSNWTLIFREDSSDNEVLMGMVCLISKTSKFDSEHLQIYFNKIWSKNLAGKCFNHMQLLSIKIPFF